MLRLALTPRWLAGLVLALGLATVFVSLSAWQIDRAQHRNETVRSTDLDTVVEFTEALEPQEPMPGLLADQRISLSGRYLPGMQVAVPGRLLDGEEGYWVVTMFEPDGATLPAHEDYAGGFTVEDQVTIAVPVVRGWTADRQTALDSRAADRPVTITGRLGPAEPPEGSRGLGEGELATVSTARLAGEFGVYSYGAIVFPEEEQGAGASYAAGDLRAFPPPQTAEGESFNWQSAVYAVEWLIFAAFALHIWWRLLRDDYERRREHAAAGPGGAGGLGDPAGASGQGTAKIEYTVVKEAGEKRIHG